MILRVIRGRADPERLAAFRTSLAPTVGLRSNPPGRTRLHLATRAGGDDLDVLLLAFWSSFEAAAAADAEGISALSLAGRSLLDLDAKHFEIDETVLRHAEGRPIAIRLATGHFSKPGADLVMQHLLRQRMPLIGDEMTEAYVGRRLDGRSVDVLFVSAWQRLPDDRRLEDTFWPDIVVNYDRFTVEVFTPLEVAEHID